MRLDSTQLAVHRIVSEAIDHYYKFSVLNNCPVEGCRVCRAVDTLDAVVGTDELANYLRVISKIKNGVLIL